jgi:agmatine/peptidylarginine deiminase
MTPAEAKLPLPSPLLDRTAPPPGEVHCTAEYEPNEGLLIRWGSYNAVLTELTVGATTMDEQTMMYILVTGPSQQSSATSVLSSAGADMDQVEFITYSANTVWIRDYGPRYIFENDARAVIDHTYNRPRPLDNAFNDFLCELWEEPQYQIPLTHGGGNFHLFTTQDAFMSDLILDENPGLTGEDVEQLFLEYQNLELTIFPGFPTSFDSTQHIDMWMFPVADDAIIIGEYDSSTGQPYTITENATTDLISRGYTVFRTPGWNSGGTHYTYTNAVVLNDVVFVSEFGPPYTSQDAEAQAVFASAFPDKQIIPVDCSDIIHAAGAIHCIVMHVPAYLTTMTVTPGGMFEAQGPEGGPFEPASATYTLSNSADIPLQYEVTADAPWLTIMNGSGMIPEGSSVEVVATINEEADALDVGVYAASVDFVNLMNHDGDTSRQVELVVGVPQPVHVFDFETDPGWSREGQWAFGEPSGQGGSSYGNPDPSSGATGSNVFGINLGGDYTTSAGPAEQLTSGAIDCSQLAQVSLRFQRWLNTDYQPYVIQTVEASTDGVDWTMLWQNPGSEDVTDSQWNEQVYDLSTIADGVDSLFLRWGHHVGQSGAWAYSGWNIDDVEVWGIPLGDSCPADLDGNGAVDVADLLVVLAEWGQPGGPADLDGNGVVDVADLLELLSAWGPC